MKKVYKNHLIKSLFSRAKTTSLLRVMMVVALLWAIVPVVSAQPTMSMSGNTFTFTWDQAYGTAPGVTVNGAQFETDGGFFLLKVYDKDDNLLIFGDVFQEFQIGGIDYPNGPSDRLKADFTGASSNGNWGTKFLSDNPGGNGSLRGTDLNGALFYGVLVDQGPTKDDPRGTVGFLTSASGSDDKEVYFKSKTSLPGAPYYIDLEFYEPFRPGTAGSTAGFYTYEEFAGSKLAPKATVTLEVTVHNETQDVWYATIQDAIDDAANGDVITLADVTYEEKIQIDKPLTLQAKPDLKVGSTPVIDGGGSGVVVTISASNVTLDGLTIQKSGSTNPNAEAGVLVYNATSVISGVTIKNCTIQDNINGIAINGGTGNNIANNVIKNNTYYAVALIINPVPGSSVTTSHTVSGNEISDCGVGVYVDKYCAGNEITENEISAFSEEGIYLYATQDNSVTDNTITGNNTAGSSGIELSYSSGNEITGNTISGNDYGIELRKRIYTGNTIEYNSITGNDQYGLIFHDPEPLKGEIEVVIAKCNWWGTIVDTEIEALIEGDVEYSPWLLSDDIENVVCLEGMAYNVDTDTWYDSAQDAIDAADEGEEVKVYYQPGNPLNIDKELEIHYIFNEPQP